MPVQCDMCARAPQYGNRVSHSKRHTPRRWLPNIQRISIREGGRTIRLKVCARCLRTLRKVH